MAQVHVIANQKGGAGKTTVAMNLAAAVADVLSPAGDPDKSPVLVVSTDPQASSVWWSKRIAKRVEKAQEHGDEAVRPLPFDYWPDQNPGVLERLKRHPRYMHIFVDSPGTFEDTGVLNETLTYADDVVVPMETEALSYEPTTRTIEKVIKPREIPFRVVLNKWDPRTAP